MPETIVTNMPTAAIWIIAAAQIVFALSVLLIALATVSLLGAVKNLIGQLTEVTKETKDRLPRVLNSWEQR
jgi:hypothetical protein